MPARPDCRTAESHRPASVPHLDLRHPRIARARCRCDGLAGGRANVPDPSREARRALPAGRLARHHRPPDRAASVGNVGPGGRRREQARRRRQHRRRLRRQVAAGRLHDPAGRAVHARGEPQPVREDALRRGQGLRADHADRDHAQRARRQRGDAGQQRQGIHRVDQGQSRQARVRFRQQRQRGTLGRRTLQGRHGHRRRPHPVQGRGAGDAGAAGRRHAVHVRQPRQRDGAGQGRQAEGARRDDGATLAAGPRTADDGRSRAARLRHLDVVRAVRAGGDPGGDRRQVERRRHEDPDDAGRARETDGRWRRTRAGHAGAIRADDLARDSPSTHGSSRRRAPRSIRRPRPSRTTDNSRTPGTPQRRLDDTLVEPPGRKPPRCPLRHVRDRRVGAGLPDQADPHRRPVPGRRHDRRPRPRGGAEAHRDAGPARGRRQPAGRRRQHRRRTGREEPARRLHAADGHRRHARDQPEPLPEAALRPCARLRAGDPRRRRAQRAGDQPVRCR